MTKWGPLGQAGYERTYARRKPDGTSESWADTVNRVVHGNLALVDPVHHLDNEAERLTDLITNFAVLPGGRHLWVSGVPGRQFLYNCHRAGWGEHLADHFTFMFSELMKGGGVGANYSTSYLAQLPAPAGPVELAVVCAATHDDSDEVAPLLSSPTAGAVVYEVDDSREGWVDSLRLVLDTAETGGGQVAIDVSEVRPRGSVIRGFGGTASGPAPLIEMLRGVTEIINRCAGSPLSSLDAMDLDHAIAKCVVAGNVRRSARMSIKHWADADIVDFIQAKADTGDHWSTNISVEVDDQFFEAHAAGVPQALVVFEAVVDGMLTNGEPGFFNSSAASIGERGDVRSTNPCGEIALEPWEPCLIGSVNLARFGNDITGATEAARLLTRFLVRATFAPIEDDRQRAIVDENRRIGVGLLGFQEWALASRCRYSDIRHSITLGVHLEMIADAARQAAKNYAAELGIPVPIKTTSIQPTGSTSQLSGHTAGIHPIYARHFIRRIRYAENDPLLADHVAKGRHVEPCTYTSGTSVVSIPTRDQILDDYPEELIEQADEIDPEAMLATQAFVQEHFADNAVSFTVNVPEGYAHRDLARALIRYLPKLKGTTVMVDGTRPPAPFERITRDEYEAATGQAVGQAMDDCSTGACPVR